MGRRPGGVGLGYLPKGGAAAAIAANEKAGVKTAPKRAGVPVGVRPPAAGAAGPCDCPRCTAATSVPPTDRSVRASARGAIRRTEVLALLGATAGTLALAAESLSWLVR